MAKSAKRGNCWCSSAVEGNREWIEKRDKDRDITLGGLSFPAYSNRDLVRVIARPQSRLTKVITPALNA